KGAKGHRTAAKARHLASARRQTLFRGRDGALYQRADPGDGRLFRRAERTAAGSAARRAAARWRVELRSPEEPVLLVPHHDLRIGGPARVPKSARALRRDQPVAKARGGVSSEAAPVPLAAHRQRNRSKLDAFRLS